MALYAVWQFAYRVRAFHYTFETSILFHVVSHGEKESVMEGLSKIIEETY